MTKHAVVTGGAGFIGSHVADAYVQRGWRVSVVDNLSTGSRDNVSGRVEFHEADVRDAKTVDLIRALQPDVINHHAAQIDVRVSVADPAGDAETNIIGSLRLLQAAVDCGVKRFLFASTGGAMYGEPAEVPQSESHPVAPLSPYGCAKLAVEQYMHAFRVTHGLSCVALRYANVYGPRQNAHGEAGVIAIFANKLFAGEPVTINGNGEQTRDFVYVADVVAANVAATDGDWQGSFNVGTGIETSINTIYDEIARLTATERAPIHGPAKTGEQLRSVLDGRALRAKTNLPEPTALRDGLRQTIGWFRGLR